MNASKRDLRGRWPSALLSLVSSILFVLMIRWALLEPVVIPSGSMIPALLIHDYVLINKFAFGLRVPFSQKWLIRWGQPQRGDVIVFQSTQDKSILLIKRVVGLPGETISLEKNGDVKINRQLISAPLPNTGNTFDSPEQAAENEADPERNRSLQALQIPEGHFFMMGDNRDHSYDSRHWGTLPFESIQGRAVFIWMSCEETLQDMPRVCDPLKFRWNRFFKMVR